jgi:hypothetical protein
MAAGAIIPFRKTSRLGPDKGGCRIPTKAGTVSLRMPICKDCRIRKDEDTSLPNVVLVHTPQSQAREDLESIAARIEALAPDMRAFVATNSQPNKEINDAIRSEPTLVFSPLPLNVFEPARGKIYQGGSVDKVSQFRRLVEIGVATPKTKLLEKGDVFPLDAWREFVVLKPNAAKLQSNGKMTYRIATKKLNYDLAIAGMFDQYNIEGGTLVQDYINTGPELEYQRVLTLFGEPLYALSNHLTKPIDLKASDYPTGTVAIATQAYPSERKAATMISDSRYLDIARSAYPAFPDRALQAIDVIRDHDTDKLYILEMNLGGNTWHFSSRMINQVVGSPKRRAEFRKKKLQQFGAFDVAARVLAEKARQEAL